MWQMKQEICDVRVEGPLDRMARKHFMRVLLRKIILADHHGLQLHCPRFKRHVSHVTPHLLRAGGKLCAGSETKNHVAIC